MHRAGTRRGKQREGSAKRCGQLIRQFDTLGRQRHLFHHAALVGQFVQMAKTLAECAGRVDARDDQHGHGIGARLPHCGNGIGQPRPGDDEGDAGLAGYAGVAVGHEARALLVTRRDMADFRARQPAIEFHGVHARDAEHGVDAVLLEQ